MYTHTDPQFIYILLISLIVFYFIASTSFIVLVIFVVGGIELSFFSPQVGPVLSGLSSWSLAVRGCRPQRASFDKLRRPTVLQRWKLLGNGAVCNLGSRWA
jgi:hypothetical protein